MPKLLRPRRSVCSECIEMRAALLIGASPRGQGFRQIIPCPPIKAPSHTLFDGSIPLLEKERYSTAHAVVADFPNPLGIHFACSSPRFPTNDRLGNFVQGISGRGPRRGLGDKIFSMIPVCFKELIRCCHLALSMLTSSQIFGVHVRWPLISTALSGRFVRTWKM